MPNRFESSFQERIVPAANRMSGVEVRLVRDSTATAAFTARRNDIKHAAMGQEFGLEVRFLMRDFIVPVSAIVLDGRTVEPLRGDRIEEGKEVFEILPPDDNTPAVELQAGGFEYLVHTKRVE